MVPWWFARDGQFEIFNRLWINEFGFVCGSSATT